jgi:hypothetical protein
MMPQIETWPRFPQAIRDHLVDRMRERKISLDDLNRLRIWIESGPTFPKAHGTRTLDRSKSAVKVPIQKHSCWPVRQQRAGHCKA